MTLRQTAVAALLLCAASAPAAHADIMSISVAGMIQQRPCPAAGCVSDLNNGVMIANNFARYYAAVDFPVNGNKICSLSFIYQDINANDAMTARLMRKSFVVGSAALDPPSVVAFVQSAAGVVDTVRKSTKRLATPATINETSGAYYVEIEVPTVNLNVLGVQIDHRAACP